MEFSDEMSDFIQDSDMLIKQSTTLSNIGNRGNDHYVS